MAAAPLILSVTGDTVITAIAGIAVAVVAGSFTFAGVIYNARKQVTPRRVTIDVDELDQLRRQLLDRDRELLELAADRDHWRDVALRWMPRRRRTDPTADDDDPRD